MHTSPRMHCSAIVTFLVFAFVIVTMMISTTLKADAATADKEFSAWIDSACSGASKVYLMNDSPMPVGFELVVNGVPKPHPYMVDRYNAKTIVVNAKPGTIIKVILFDGELKSATTKPKCTGVKAKFRIDRDSRLAIAAMQNRWEVPMNVNIDAITPSGKIIQLSKYTLEPFQQQVVDIDTSQLPKNAILRSRSGVVLDFIKVG